MQSKGSNTIMILKTRLDVNPFLFFILVCLWGCILSILTVGILQHPLLEALYADQHSRKEGGGSSHLREPWLYRQIVQLQTPNSGILFLQTLKLSSFSLQKKSLISDNWLNLCSAFLDAQTLYDEGGTLTTHQLEVESVGFSQSAKYRRMI